MDIVFFLKFKLTLELLPNINLKNSIYLLLLLVLLLLIYLSICMFCCY